MNIRQEISAVRPVWTLYAVPYYSRKCLLLCNACTHGNDQRGGVNGTACFHNTAQLHVCSNTDNDHHVYFKIFNQIL